MRYIYRCRLHQQAAFVLQEKRGNRGVEMSGQRIKKLIPVKKILMFIRRSKTLSA